MLDMIGPKKANLVCLSDLRNCPMTPIFFDTFFNLEKYLDHEQRDPFASQRDMDEDGNEVHYKWITVSHNSANKRYTWFSLFIRDNINLRFYRCPIGIDLPLRNMNCS